MLLTNIDNLNEIYRINNPIKVLVIHIKLVIYKIFIKKSNFMKAINNYNSRK